MALMIVAGVMSGTIQLEEIDTEADLKSGARQFPPKGYGPAMDCALRSASGDVVITLDCDDTYPTEDIPRFVKAIDGR